MMNPLRMTGSWDADAAADMDPLREKADELDEIDEERLRPAILDEYVEYCGS